MILQVGESSLADDVEDLKGAYSEDLRQVGFATEGPSVEVWLGETPHAWARDGSQEARDLIRDVQSLVSALKEPRRRGLVALSAVRFLGFGPGLAFVVFLILDLLGVIDPSGRLREAIGVTLPPALLAGFTGSIVAFKMWVRADYETAVIPHRRGEVRQLKFSVKVGANWQLVSGLTLLAVGIPCAVITAWLNGLFGLGE
ncbi:hypothetical protein [Streptomyces boncukensis]|uniref:Uncharacterized protein n=1 Tax=Streptomyces boncukensis TaxID=2711219 RepID=A0A6G4WPY9_9ACTN|nr:hypothetical protein [Streptomyces boncukensis]NGO67158.1 hypothetical protein [Streptomyces boncukensis]